MNNPKNGINMMSVKKGNRKAILNLVYHNGRLSRKEMAARLGLTPAAITLIANDMIEEGLLLEAEQRVTNKKGRKEMLLELNATRYAVIGVFVSRHHYHVRCIDLANNLLFEQSAETHRMRRKSALILDAVAGCIRQCLAQHKVLESHRLLGLGVAVNGMVDSRAGVSLNSYGTWELDVPVRQILEDKLGMQVFLTNNICSLAHGESFLSGDGKPQNMLFIKYGPGVGATRFCSEGSPSVFDYSSIEVGHLIVEPQGAPCVCGNQGCLETIVSYNSIENSIAGLISEEASPILYDLTEGDGSRLNMEIVLKAYDAGDKLASQAMERTAFYLAMAIQNAQQLFAPDAVVLYGEPLQNKRFAITLREKLGHYNNSHKVSFSNYNLQLETFGPAATMISYFFENGGILKEPVEAQAN